MPNSRTILLACSLATVLAVVAGCGGGQEAANSDGSAGTAPGATASATSNPADGGAVGPAAEPVNPMVLIETSLGEITVELDPDKAELTVDNFLRNVDNGYYNNTIFHQVLKDYVVLGGSYTPDLVEKPAEGTVRNEAFKAPKNSRGTIAMARKADVIDSAATQFFFNVADNPMLDHQDAEVPEQYGYCVFGEVVKGMDVIEKISGVEVEDRGDFERKPVQTVLIQSVERIR